MLRSLPDTSPSSGIAAAILFCLYWTLAVYVFATQPSLLKIVEADAIPRNINQAVEMLEACEQRNQKLQRMIEAVIKLNQSAGNDTERFEYSSLEGLNKMESVGRHASATHAPSLEYELMRRRIQQNIGEMWNFFRSELRKIQKQVTRKQTNNINHVIDQVLMLGAEHKRSLLSDMERLRQLDGYEAWRHQEAQDLSELVQKRIHHLQNPPDCAKARKAVVDFNANCGYGCQLHHAVYYFIIAYATARTFILHSDLPANNHSAEWKDFYQPISASCLEVNGAMAQLGWSEPEAQVIVFPTTGFLAPQPPYVPPAIPEDLAARLKRLHGSPPAWWIGQFFKYLLRLQPGIKEFLESHKSKLGWQRPIVGVHVRRTDKVGTEAAFHGIEEYMRHVEDYFLTLEINGTAVPRRIYLATDDAHVISEARKKYPQYEVIADAEVARMAALNTRNTDFALNGIRVDIHLLSLCDHLVCTFSSNICRVAYEIMQTLYPDAAQRFKSLDEFYTFNIENPHNRVVVIPHKARNSEELHLQPGDMVDVADNLWNGFSQGRNKRTNQSGLFPSFKVVDKVETVKMATYPGV